MTVLEVGKAGSAGVGTGVLPLLRDGVVVATLHASNWKESATAAIGPREWVFTKQKGRLTGRPATDPEHTARLGARQTSFWSGTWTVDLEGTVVERQTVSYWKGTHRYLVGGREMARGGSTGGWSPRPALETAEPMPLEHQVFCLWLELVISRRNTAATTAVVAGGAAAAGGS